MLTLWQAEWCPASRLVRQRLTELGIAYLTRQVPVEREQRADLLTATGNDSVPALVDGAAVLVGAEAILDHLNSRFPEPPEAHAHHEKAAKVQRKHLEETCPQLRTTH